MSLTNEDWPKWDRFSQPIKMNFCMAPLGVKAVGCAAGLWLSMGPSKPAISSIPVSSIWGLLCGSTWKDFQGSDDFSPNSS